MGPGAAAQPLRNVVAQHKGNAAPAEYDTRVRQWKLGGTKPALEGIISDAQVEAANALLMERGQATSLVAADTRGWLALAYTIFIGGIVGFGLWFWLIGRCSMGRVAPFGLLLPVFALISSVLFLGDRITPKLIVGGLLAISGVALTQIRPSARLI